MTSDSVEFRGSSWRATSRRNFDSSIVRKYSSATGLYNTNRKNEGESTAKRFPRVRYPSKLNRRNQKVSRYFRAVIGRTARSADRVQIHIRAVKAFLSRDFYATCFNFLAFKSHHGETNLTLEFIIPELYLSAISVGLSSRLARRNAEYHRGARRC